MTQDLRETLHIEYELAHDRLRPDGVDAVRRTTTRRRRLAGAAAATAMVLLASAALAGWRSTGGGLEQVGAPCGRSGYRASVALTGSVTGEQRAGVEHETKLEAYERFQQQFREDPELAATVTVESMPESFQIVLARAADWAPLQARLAPLPAVGFTSCECRTRIG